MRTLRGKVLGALAVLAVVTAGCSSSSSSKGVSSATTASPATTTAGDATTAPEATTAGSDAPATSAAAAVPKQGGTLKVGIGSDPPALDPAGNSSSLENGTIYDAIYDGLMRYQRDGSVQPMLAESLTEAPDRLSWTMTLRQGVTFHDGTPFDAAAVKFNIDRQKTSLYNSSAIIPITSVDVVDASTVKFNLSQPWTALPNALAGVVGDMASPTAVASNPDALLRNPVGTGPYKFVSWTPGDKIVVQRNDAYWGETKGYLDEIDFKLIPVEAARIAAFEAGELDVMLSINDETAKAEQDKQVVFAPSTGYGLTLLNQTRPPFDDVRVRQALQIGYDRDAIAEAYQGQNYADYAWSPFVKGSTWWSPPSDGSTLSYDPDKAKALIEDYGKPVEFTLLVLKGNQMVEDATRATVEFWASEGIKANIEIVPDLGTYVQRVVVSGDFDAVGWINGSFGDPDGFLYNQLHTGGSSNYGKYSSAAMDALLDQGRTESDTAKRKEIYTKAQDLFRTDVPFLQSSHGPLYLIATDKVVGLENSVFLPARTVAFAG